MSEDLEVARHGEMLAKARQAKDQLVAFAIQKPTCVTALYAPTDLDTQEPHDQDEIYIVASGSATLVMTDEKSKLGTGDAAFVAAKAQHHFTELSDDFSVWAVFPLPYAAG